MGEKTKTQALLQGIAFVSLVLLLGYFMGHFEFHFSFVFLIGGVLALWKYTGTVRRSKREKMVQAIANRTENAKFPQFESVEWVNGVVNLFWRCSVNSWNPLLTEKMNALLAEQSPSFISSIRVENLNLGSNPPIAEAIDAAPSFTDRDLRLDFSFGWVSSFSAVLKGKLKSGIKFSVLIHKLVMQSRMRVEGKLHPDSPFYFGSLKISSFEKPKIEFKAKAYGHINVVEMPAVGSWIRQFISRDLIENLIVLPNFIPIALCPEPTRDFVVGSEKRDLNWDVLQSELKRSVQYGGNYLKKNDWKQLISEVDFQSQIFNDQAIVVVDGPANVCEPTLCRVIQGSIAIYVVPFDEANPYIGPMNPDPSLEEETDIQLLKDGVGVKLGSYGVGQYFGEQSFVSSFRKPDQKTWCVVFVAESEHTEVVGISDVFVRRVLESNPLIHSRFYMMCAHSFRNTLNEANKVKKDPLKAPAIVEPSRPERRESKAPTPKESEGNDTDEEHVGLRLSMIKGLREKKKNYKENREKERESGGRKKSAVDFAGQGSHLLGQVQDKLRRGSVNPQAHSGDKNHPKDPKASKHWTKLFRIPPDQGILSTHNCQMKQKEGNGTWVSGTLCLFQDFVGFYGSFFGTKIKFLSRYFGIRLQPHPNSKYANVGIHLTSPASEEFFKFSRQDLRDSVMAAFQSGIDSASDDKESGIPESSVPLDLSTECDTPGLTERDWKLMIAGSQGLSFTKDQMILKEGEVSFGLYQIAVGTVRIEKKIPGKGNIVVATLGSGEIFGEMSLLMCQQPKKEEESLMKSTMSSMMSTLSSPGAAAGASVLADSDEVDVYYVSGEYLFKHFETEEGLSGRFYHYLCNVFSERLLRTINRNLS